MARKTTDKTTKKAVKKAKKLVTVGDIRDYTQDSLFRVIFETMPDSAEDGVTHPADYWTQNSDAWRLVTACLNYAAKTCVPTWNPGVDYFWGEEIGDCGLVKAQFETVTGGHCVLSFIKDSDTVGLKAEITAFYVFNEHGVSVTSTAEYEVRGVASLRDIVDKASMEAKAKALRTAADAVEAKAKALRTAAKSV